MTRRLSEQAALLDEPTLLEAFVPAALLEAAALDHALLEGHAAPHRSVSRDTVYATDGGQPASGTPSSDMERDTYCPNCLQEGRENYSVDDADFEERDCDNPNCRVSLYKVHSIDTETDRGDGGVEC